jgi:hypothetical protein
MTVTEDENFESLPEYQRHQHALEERYENGGLDFERHALEDCFNRFGDEIRKFADDSPEITREMAIVKWLFMKRNISMPVELAEQRHEAERYQHHLEDTGQHVSLEKAAYDWAGRFAAGWRDFSITGAAYVFHMEQDYFLEILWPKFQP